jgi:hypothetical protein
MSKKRKLENFLTSLAGIDQQNLTQNEALDSKMKIISSEPEIKKFKASDREIKKLSTTYQNLGDM